MLTTDQILAASEETDRRLARTATASSRKRLPRAPKVVRTGLPTEVYSLVTGRPVKQPERASVEKTCRKALRALDPARYETGLTLSRALDAAELAGVPAEHPLVERCAEALARWESEDQARV